MRAIYRRYGNTTGLQQLDDTIEISAHQAAIKRAQSAKTVSI
jgi:hypothetical protein